MKVLIGGDVVPTETNIERFSSSNFIDKFDSEFKNIWQNADYRLFNLECPLGNINTFKPIKKSGPNLIADANCINGIKSLNPNLICLANNHILDYGKEGLDFTQKLLDENSIEHIGIINNIQEEMAAQYFFCDNVKIGIYNLCETEFSNATSNSSGANPYKEIETFTKLKEIKENCDFLIVIYHGGKEFYRYPSPSLKKRCESFVDCGADFVTCQHTHCIGCEQKYKGSTILYGQGNFIFDSGKDEFWKSGLLVELDLKEKSYSVNYIPIEKANGLFKMSEDNSILEKFYERSKEIEDNDFIEKKYEEFCNKLFDEYIRKFEYHNIYDKTYHKIFRKYPKRDYPQSFYLNLLNTVRCESHREVIIRGLELRSKE